jgi:hypothetical protein
MAIAYPLYIGTGWGSCDITHVNCREPERHESGCHKHWLETCDRLKQGHHHSNFHGQATQKAQLSTSCGATGYCQMA